MLALGFFLMFKDQEVSSSVYFKTKTILKAYLSKFHPYRN